MDLGKRLLVAATLAGFVAAAPLVAAQADKLDDVINEGKVRCAVVLDFPPIGFYDENNERPDSMSSIARIWPRRWTSNLSSCRSPGPSAFR